MAQLELILPRMGESVAEATITSWLKNVGDTIEEEESIIEIATDKVDSEVPSTHAGVLVKQLFQEGEVVPVGKAFAIIETDSNASAHIPEKGAKPAKQQAIEEETAEVFTEKLMKPVAEVEKSSNGKFYSPLVRNIAKTEGISMVQLDQIEGSGKDGRVTKQDLLDFIENGTPSAKISPADNTIASTSSVKQEASKTLVIEPQKVITTTEPSQASPKIDLMPGDEIIEMDRMRKLISEHMTMSKRVSAHVTSFVEVDVTNMVNWRNKIKEEFLKREGENITFTPIIIESVVKAIKELPMVNVSVDGTKIIKRKNINIGMATALPNGNLIVPVIKKADEKNMIGLTKAVNDLANRARENKLQADEIQGGTFTITNVGTFGNVMGTPIINQPQVAIMAVGVIKKKPVVIETPDGDTIGIRHMMFISLSYDHRVVDGALGGRFLRKVADILEDFETERPI